MVPVLSNHIGHHAVSLIFITFATYSAPTPGNFFPNQNSQTIAEIQANTRLLVMPQTDKICSHVFYHNHFFADLLFGHGRANSGVVFVTMGSF